MPETNSDQTKQDSKPGEYIDTDKTDVRVQRIKAQHTFESGPLDNLKGKSVIDRYFAVRESVFGELGQVGNQPPYRLVADVLVYEWPAKELVARLYLPRYVRLIDELQERTEQIDDVPARSETGLRLACLSYCLGILMHQANDGNGQTQRLISLSYIREFCHQFQDSFFPFKFPQQDYKYFKSLVPMYSAVQDQAPFVLNEKDRQAHELIFEISKAQYEARRPEGGTLEDTLRDRLVPSVEKAKALGVTVPEGEIAEPLSLGPYLIDRLWRVLQARNPGFFYAPSEGGKKTFVLTCLLTTLQGKEILSSYVHSGADHARNRANSISEPRVKDIALRTIDSLEQLKADFEEVLSSETADVHQHSFAAYFSSM